MASANTFSPDALHGGPVIVTLSGKFNPENQATTIDRGDVLFFEYTSSGQTMLHTEPPLTSTRKDGEDVDTYFMERYNADIRMAIVAEAVTLTHNQLKHQSIVHVPCVVYGRTWVKLNVLENMTLSGGDFGFISDELIFKPGTPAFGTRTRGGGGMGIFYTTDRTYYRVTFIQSKEDLKKVTFTNGHPVKDLNLVDVFVEPYQCGSLTLATDEEKYFNDGKGEEEEE